MSNLTKKQKKALLDKYQKQIESGELIQLQVKDKHDFRQKWLSKQKNICPILKQKIKFKDSIIDHRHKLKSDELGGEEGLGLVRGILHFSCNAWEGKVVNSFKRTGLSKKISISDALRNLADYLDKEKEPIISPIYIYPGEEPREKKKELGKRAYNRVVKHYFSVYPRKRKLPKKNKYLTKAWKRYLIDIDIYLRKEQEKKQRRKKRKQ